MGTISRQLVPHGVERLADPRDIAVPEDREHAAEDRYLAPVDYRHLPGQEFRHGLRHGQADRFGHRLFLRQRQWPSPAPLPQAGEGFYSTPLWRQAPDE